MIVSKLSGLDFKHIGITTSRNDPDIPFFIEYGFSKGSEDVYIQYLN